MRKVEKSLKCDIVLCPGCQKYELDAEISAAGLSSLSVGDPEPDNAIWDRLDGAFGIRTREPVQAAMDRSDDYCFGYPTLYIDHVAQKTLEDAERSGATIEREHHGIAMRWGLPSPCGILPLSKYWIAIDDTVTWGQLRKEARDYCRDDGLPVPKGDDLLSRAKKTVRHKHTTYDAVRDTLKSLGRLESRGVDAIRLAFNEEIEQVYPHLKGF